jgi:CheY-like chemotaxis protein
VLFVEDSPANVQLMRDILSRRPEVTLLVADTGVEAVELARERGPDLVLLDLNLPDIDGQEVLRRLRADDATEAIPVVVVSADATPAQVERLLAQGATDYVTKPFSLDRIMVVVDRTSSDPPAPTRRLVVYVEDDRANSNLMANLFERNFPSLDLLVASRGAECLPLAVEHQPSLILLDAGLPDVPGLEVVRRLRGDERTSDIPIAIVSGSPPAPPDDGPQADAHLMKPFGGADLRRLVDDLLGDRLDPDPGA